MQQLEITTVGMNDTHKTGLHLNFSKLAVRKPEEKPSEVDGDPDADDKEQERDPYVENPIYRTEPNDLPWTM